jgi:hypothetical protein
MIGQGSRGWMERGVGRTMVRLGAVTALAAGLTACGGEGGGDSSDDVDLRAAYDRINRSCMTYSDVEKAVGRSADEAPHSGRRNWVSGNQQLFVTFAERDPKPAVISGVTWNVVPGGELDKSFSIECGNV